MDILNRVFELNIKINSIQKIEKHALWQKIFVRETRFAETKIFFAPLGRAVKCINNGGGFFEN